MPDIRADEPEAREPEWLVFGDGEGSAPSAGQPARRACEEIHAQGEREEPDQENAARMQGDDSSGCSPAAHRATRHV